MQASTVERLQALLRDGTAAPNCRACSTDPVSLLINNKTLIMDHKSSLNMSLTQSLTDKIKHALQVRIYNIT